MKSVTSVVTRKSFTVPESSGAGPGKSYSNLILNGIISEHFVIDACSCSTAATQCANCSSAVLAGNQNLNFTHKIGGKKTICGRETNLISNNYTLISGQLGQSVDISRISPGNRNNIKLRYNPQKSQNKPDEPEEVKC